MDQKLKVGILGGTGMVGQRFISLLENHPWYEVTTIAASPRSAGKTYEEAVGGRWKMQTPMPEAVKNIVVMNVNEVEKVASQVDFVFSAVDMSKEEIRAIEDEYAKTETPVVSNNSAHRWTPDVPMVVPEINPEHFEVIEAQKKRLGTKKGFVAVKPNCSIQSYAPALFALKEFGPKEVVATTYQAISGAGKTFSPRSAGKTYEEAVGGRWKMQTPMPEAVKNIVVMNVNEVEKVASQVDFVFSAVDMSKEEIRAIEDEYAKTETPVVSNNSAHRWTPDVPMVVPEINPEHFEVIEAQKKRLGTKKGFVAVKPNCSIQSYAPALFALKEFGPKEVVATTYQAISGAGKTFKDWPEMVENVIPYIGGEEEKSEQEPLKLFGKVVGDHIEKAELPVITTQCVRVPVLDGHTAAVFVNFEKKPTKEQIIECWRNYKGLPQELNLPSAPKQFIQYMEEDNRPQVKEDVNFENGMGISMGRLREDKIYDYKFIGLSHNTVRGAAGGAILCAELLTAQGYISAK